jgi:hypothetical protein
MCTGLSSGMRGIDHLVLPVTTLSLARTRLTALGFNVAPDARHPFGTGNACVFFANRSYLEPITILDRGAADLAAAEGLFFVKRIKRFTERQGEGFAMAALKSADAEADAAAFERAGIGAGTFRFARPATQPDGSEREIGVALAYAEAGEAPDATFFACQHLAADALFQPDFLAHPNGATGVAAITAVAKNPADFRRLLTGATGQRELRGTPMGIEALVGGQSIAILTRAGFVARYGVAAPDPRRGLLFAALDLAVDDLEQAARFAGPNALHGDARIVVPAAPGLGAVLAFRKDLG